MIWFVYLYVGKFQAVFFPWMSFSSGAVITSLLFKKSWWCVSTMTYFDLEIQLECLLIFSLAHFLPSTLSFWSNWGFSSTSWDALPHPWRLAAVPRILYFLMMFTTVVTRIWGCLEMVLYPLPLTCLSIILCRLLRQLANSLFSVASNDTQLRNDKFSPWFVHAMNLLTCDD